MSDGMRLAREGRINLLERMGSTRPHLEEIMRRLIDAGFLRDVDPEILVMQFIGPLLFWRQLHAIGAKTALIRNRHAFARAHVDQFLNGAAAEPSVVPSRVRQGAQRVTTMSSLSTSRNAVPDQPYPPPLAPGTLASYGETRRSGLRPRRRACRTRPTCPWQHGPPCFSRP